ncbi:retrotransposon protein, putative, ty1-copia subclass, partial [Tanacetum coccineum]
GLRTMGKLKHGALNLYVGNGMRPAVEAIRSFDLILPNGLVIVLDNFHYAPSITRGVVSLSCLVDNGYKHTFMNYCISVMKDDVLMQFHVVSVAQKLNMVPTKKVDKTPYEIWNRKALNFLTLHEASRSDIGLELLQELDTQPLKNTSEQHDEVKHNKVEPHSEKVPIRISKRISQAPDGYGFYVDAEEHELRILMNLLNIKLHFPDLESNKWVDAINAEIQSMKNNQVWCLVDLPPNGRTKKDVKPTFLNGQLSGDVYMVQSEGFVDPKHPSKVCKLQRSIYGSKQASRRWNKIFDEEIKKVGFTQNPDESCVYVKASRSNIVFLVLYVDDILIMGNNIPMLQDIKSWLCKCFSLKYLEAAYILGINIIRDRSKRLIALSQSAYFTKILKKFEMENSKRGSVPMQEKPNLSKAQGANTPDEMKCMQRVPYASTIESIIYESAKQNTIVMSSTKAEYIAAAEALMEAVWMRKFIDGLGNVMPTNKRPMEMLCDNTSAIAIANDPGIMKGARHYQWKYHYIHEAIQNGEIVLSKVHTDDNIADLFTKPMLYTKNLNMLWGLEFVLLVVSLNKEHHDYDVLDFFIEETFEPYPCSDSSDEYCSNDESKDIDGVDFHTEGDHNCPTFKNRISESYHKAIIVQRSKPIITMLEDIMIYLMKRAGSQEGRYVHAVIGYMHLNKDPNVGVSQRYSQEKWLSAYQFSIKHVCGTSMWKRTGNQPPIPPILRKMLGRPRKNRIKGPSKNNSQVNRFGRRMTCTNCLEVGHNKSTYDKDLVPKTPKPRKTPCRKKEPKSVSYASFRGRGSRVEVVIEVLDVHMLMEEAEVRRNLEHEYMEYILMDEEEIEVGQKENEV